MIVHIHGADLVSVSSPLLLSYIQAAPVSCEAAVGPVGVVKAEQATVLRVTWILDGDGAGHHGDDTVASCTPLPLNGGRKRNMMRRKLKAVDGLKFFFNWI